MIAVAVSDGLVCLKDVQRSLGLDSASNIQKPWASLQDGGLLVPVESGEAGRRRWYRRADSKAWDWAKELAQEFGYSLPNPSHVWAAPSGPGSSAGRTPRR